MKLIIWNKENSYSPSKSAEHRTIRVNRHGYIYLSGALAAEMDLKHGSRLNMAHDEENPKDWYLCKTQDETGFLLRGDRHKACRQWCRVLERLSGDKASRAG